MVACACNPSYSGGCGRRIAQEAEAGRGGCSEPRLCHCTPVWVTTVKLHLKKKKDFWIDTPRTEKRVSRDICTPMFFMLYIFYHN